MSGVVVVTGHSCSSGPKRGGSYRICGDYKVTVNSALEVDQYPLPNPSDLFASLSGGKNSKNRFNSGLSAAVT